MSLRIVRSRSSAALWEACAGRFLDELGGWRGPGAPPSFLWLAHRNQRDALLELAAGRGLPGWLSPPLAFLSELRGLFRLETRPIGILTGRLLVARLAADNARRLGLRSAARERGPARAHMVDGVLSELLPEGVAPATLRAALARLGGDDFARLRDRWVADTYESLLAELARRGRFDPRSIHALVAERIEGGGLREAIRGSGRLHVYGITSLRGRRRLFRALASNDDVEATLYLPLEEEPSEWDAEFGEADEVVGPAEPPGRVTVQPAPDGVREATWVARRVKAILAAGEARPHEVAVVARSGREDTRRIHRALEAVGVPSTARLRTRLADIPALKAILQLLSAEGEGWPYRALRQVLASPYFAIGIDLRVVDHVARNRRVEGLGEWEAAIRRVRERLATDSRWRVRRDGVYEDRLDEDLPRLAAFRRAAAVLAEERTERGWIAVTLDALAGKVLAGFRRNLCRAVAERWDLVRMDQRGVLALETLLREWAELVESEERFGAAEWHARLRRLLEANELAHSTPLQTGVQVLEAHEAALTPFRRLFVVHANEGVFPRAATGSGVYSDAERERLFQLGIPLATRERAQRRERTLWRATTAGEEVTITYRTTDSSGIPRLPSLMVPAHDARAELPRTLEPAAGEEDATGPGLEPASEPELRLRDARRLAARRRAGDGSPLHTPDPARLRHAVLCAFAEELRSGAMDGLVRSERGLVAAQAAAGGGDGGGEAEAGGRGPPDPATVLGLDRPISERPTAWNGHLRDPVVRAALRERFALGYAWSASQLETYGRRPFDFLLERVLLLGEVEEAEEETSPLAFGSVAHDLLHRFYERVKNRLPASLAAEAEAVYAAVAEEVFREAEADLERWLGRPPLWAVRREEVREKVRDYLAWELPWLADNGETPLLLEHEFGTGQEGPVELAGTDVGGEAVRMLVRGRIDRVDRRPGGGLRVVDYKSGRVPTCGGTRDGALLQGALYLRALERLGVGSPESAVYRVIKRPGDPRNGCELRARDAEAALAFALAIPARVRAGRFEAVQAASTKIEEWQPGRDVVRTQATLSAGHRFHLVAE